MTSGAHSTLTGIAKFLILASSAGALGLHVRCDDPHAPTKRDAPLRSITGPDVISLSEKPDNLNFAARKTLQECSAGKKDIAASANAIASCFSEASVTAWNIEDSSQQGYKQLQYALTGIAATSTLCLAFLPLAGSRRKDEVTAKIETAPTVIPVSPTEDAEAITVAPAPRRSRRHREDSMDHDSAFAPSGFA